MWLLRFLSILTQNWFVLEITEDTVGISFCYHICFFNAKSKEPTGSLNCLMFRLHLIFYHSFFFNNFSNSPMNPFSKCTKCQCGTPFYMSVFKTTESFFSACVSFYSIDFRISLCSTSVVISSQESTSHWNYCFILIFLCFRVEFLSLESITRNSTSDSCFCFSLFLSHLYKEFFLLFWFTFLIFFFFFFFFANLGWVFGLINLKQTANTNT